MNPELVQFIKEKLQTQGWCETQELFSKDLLLKLQEDAFGRLNRGEFKSAKIGQGANAQLRPEVRSDQTCWIQSDTKSNAVISEYLSVTDHFMKALSQHLYIPLIELESHYASYPVNGLYQKHVDCFSADEARVISMVIYLNSDWKEGDGGKLFLYSKDDKEVVTHEVSPELGTTVLFMSHEIYHEVKPSIRPRLSIAGWMKRRH